MKYLVMFTALILVLCIFCSFLPSPSDRVIYENTIRLHVLANSDSAHDQAVKLRVRDAVLQKMKALLDEAKDKENAEKVLSENLGVIRQTCLEALRQEGEEMTVTVTLSDEKYPTRVYDTMRLPKGSYRSLRIMLGRAEGKNWWCVLYPTLCTNVARTEEALMKTGFTAEQIEVLTNGESPKYKIKFKFLELFGEEFCR